MKQHLTNYALYLRARRKYSANTIELYLSDIRSFATYLTGTGVNPSHVEQISKSMVVSYLLQFQRNGLRPSSAARALSAIRSFFNFLSASHLIRHNPALDVDPPRVITEPLQILSTGDIAAIVAQAAKKEPTGGSPRDRAIIELLYGAGLRLGELIVLTIGDVDLENKLVLCRGEGPERLVPLSILAKDAIAAYLEKFGGAPERTLFLGRNGEGMTRQAYWKLVRGHAKSAGLAGNVTPQILRVSLEAHLLANGAPEGAVRDLLGKKSNLSIGAAGYSMDLLEVFRAAHPRYE